MRNHFPIETKLGWKTMVMVLPKLTAAAYDKWLSRGRMAASSALVLARYCTEQGIKWSDADFIAVKAERLAVAPNRPDPVKRKFYLPERKKRPKAGRPPKSAYQQIG